MPGMYTDDPLVTGDWEADWEHAQSIEIADPASAITIYHAIVTNGLSEVDDMDCDKSNDADVSEGNAGVAGKGTREVGKLSETLRLRELALFRLGPLFIKQGDAGADRLVKLMEELKPLFQHLAKAKTAKVVRCVVDWLGEVGTPYALQQQLSLCRSAIEWTVQGKRTFLRQRLQARLCALYLDTEQYREALALLETLIREVKRLDDKPLLVEIHLLEARTHYRLHNVPRAKAALTAARAAANAIYCPPLMQAELDMLSGTLHAEDKDYKTAFSYFFEGFENFNSANDDRAVPCLKYMLLCKIMGSAQDQASRQASADKGLRDAETASRAQQLRPTAEDGSEDSARKKREAALTALQAAEEKAAAGAKEEVINIISGKSALKYSAPGSAAEKELEAMRSVAAAHAARSLSDFEAALSLYPKQLKEDPILLSHLTALYNTLLEQNLCRLIEPFSRIEISHLSVLIGLPQDKVERKLSHMILDGTLRGILDQGSGCLVVFDDEVKERTYPAAIETMQAMDDVVSALFDRARKLT